jgi:phospholipid-translocating ATPase
MLFGFLFFSGTNSFVRKYQYHNCSTLHYLTPDRFSASVITDFTYSLYYNTFFSFGPTMYLGIFDQDVGEHLSLLVPQLYYKGIQQTLYNTQRFWLYIADGVYQSVVSFFVMYTLFFDSSMDAKGQEVSKDAMGTFLAYSIILTVNIYALMCASDLSWVAFASFAAVVGIWIIYCVSYSFVPEAYTYGVTLAFYKNPNFYAGIILSVILCLLPRLTLKFLQQYFWPSDTDIMREIQKYRSKDIRQVLNEITGHPITNEMLPSEDALQGDTDSLKDDRSVKSAKSGFVPRNSPEVSGGLRSKSEEQLPPSQDAAGKKKKRVQSAGHRFSLKEKPPKVSDGFGSSAAKESGVGSAELEQTHHKSDEIDKSTSSRIVETEGRFRKSSVSVIIKENIQKATRFVQKLGRQVSSSCYQF